MDPGAARCISELRLEPHPEGGFFRETFRSRTTVQPGDGRGPRAALTAIYFLLPAGHHSRWHVVDSDEQWTFLEGEPLELLVVDPDTAHRRTIHLGRGQGGRDLAAVVPAGSWQAARQRGGFSLVTCAVAPGFDFADFRLLADDPVARDRLRQVWPDRAALL
jgi:predicted cupin superfamily sugar epimerase